MKLSFEYQYSYFLYPFVIEKERYEKYLLKLLNDKKCKLKIFEKEKDLDIYNFFNPSIRNSFFPTFELRDDDLKEFNELSNEKKVVELKEHSCTAFDYDVPEAVQGKVGTDNGIFFEISKIEIICFNTGICFLSLKTNLEASKKFSDLLNFNYKFKEINSEFSELKKFDNINLQSSSYKDSKTLRQFIDEITGGSKKKKLVNDKFYSFSYVCIPSELWNENTDFNTIEGEFLKYVNTFPNEYISDVNKEAQNQHLSLISNKKYSRAGITKTNCNVFSSTVDTYNYTKLPYYFENLIYYTYVLRLYQKIFLTHINDEFKSYKKILKIRKDFMKFTNSLWVKEITSDDKGSLYYKKIGESLEIEELYQQIERKYEIIYKDLNIEKNNRDNTIVFLLLIISLILNIFTIISYLRLR